MGIGLGWAWMGMGSGWDRWVKAGQDGFRVDLDGSRLSLDGFKVDGDRLIWAGIGIGSG